ncbi:hypothetical protein ATO13_08246 [Stappia sp. 22II-S9-Z10]|nr:hypothetical protein ATO13_08246 [Stappia sp. 22II-S9-Z10]
MLVSNSMAAEPIDAAVFAGLPEAIPAIEELKKSAQWVAWKRVPGRNGKVSKVPVNPRTGTNARSTDPRTWTGYEEASARAVSDNLAGVGYVLMSTTAIIGIDLDNCIDESGAVIPWAQAILDAAETYAEVSPSGRGIRILARGTTHTIGASGSGVEIYTAKRFLTITGQHVRGTPTAIREAPQTLHLCGERAEAWRAEYRAQVKRERAADGPAAPVDGFGETSLAELAELVAYIPPDCPYADWLMVGMGLHDRCNGAPDGLSLWDAWSCPGVKYPGSQELEYKWRSFRGTGTRFNSVVKLASEYGADPVEISRRYRALDGFDDFDASTMQVGTCAVRAEPAANPPPANVRLLTWEEYKADQAVPRDYIVDGYVRTGTLISANSRPGLGKTALLVDISRCLSLGEPWMGRETKPCSIVYIASEDADDVANRLEAVGADDVTILVSEDPFILTKPVEASTLLRKAISLAREKAPDRPVMVVVDTLRAALGGESVIDDRVTSPGINAMRMVAEDEGIVIAIANHTNRSDPKETKGETLETAVVLEFILVEGGGGVELWVGKNRNGPGRRQIGIVTMKTVDVGPMSAAVIENILPFDPHHGDGRPRRGRPSGSAKHLVRAIVEALADHGEAKRVFDESNAPLVRMVDIEHVKPVFSRIYPVTEGAADKRADAVRKALDRAVKTATDRGFAHTGNWSDRSWWWLPETEFHDDDDFGA